MGRPSNRGSTNSRVCLGLTIPTTIRDPCSDTVSSDPDALRMVTAQTAQTEDVASLLGEEAEAHATTPSTPPAAIKRGIDVRHW